MRTQTLKWFTTQEKMPDVGQRIIWLTNFGEIFSGVFVTTSMTFQISSMFAYNFDDVGTLKYHLVDDIREWSYI